MITVDGANFTPVIQDFGGGSCRLSVGLTMGYNTYTWYVTATDMQGNQTISPTYTLTLSAE